MKKTLYMAAVLATLAGCAKTESQPENPVGSNLELTANVEGIGTKAVFDGDSHIKFEKSDAFCAAIALPSAPDKAVKVSKKMVVMPMNIILLSNLRIRMRILLCSKEIFIVY